MKTLGSGSASVLLGSALVVTLGCSSTADAQAATAGPPTLYALGTGHGTGATVGPDGMIEQALGSSGFAQIALPPQNGYLAGAAWEPASQQFYLFGNTDGANAAQSYNPATNSWKGLPNLPAGGGEGCVAAVNGVLSIIGGFDDTATATATVLAYDPTSSKYTTKKSLPTGVGDCFAVTVGSLVYHGGGSSNNQGPGTPATCSNSWFKYDPSSDTRSALASLPFGVAESASASLDGKIYVIGGYRGPAGQTVGTSSVLAYTVATDTWTQKSNFPVAVAGACAATWNGVLYVVGGFTGAGFPNSMRSTYSYNEASDSWTLAPYTLTQATAVAACGPAPSPAGFGAPGAAVPALRRGSLASLALALALGGAGLSTVRARTRRRR
jgi:hypothetical protein